MALKKDVEFDGCRSQLWYDWKSARSGILEIEGEAGELIPSWGRLALLNEAREPGPHNSSADRCVFYDKGGFLNKLSGKGRCMWAELQLARENDNSDEIKRIIQEINENRRYKNGVVAAPFALPPYNCVNSVRVRGSEIEGLNELLKQD